MGRARSRRRRGLSGGAGGTRNRTTGSSKTARTNRRNARLNAKRGTDRTGRLKISWSARDIAKRLTNNKIAKALGLHGLAGKVPKGWKANVNLKTAIKSKIGEKNYRATSANNPGSGYIPSDVLEYYEKYNPDGKTKQDFEKLYANQLKEGISLEKAMASNPAETMSYYALLDDEPTQSSQSTSDLLTVKNNNSTTNNTMALNQAQVNKLYNDMLGRNATFGDASEYDADYWVGKTADQVKSGISGSSEFLNRKALVDAAGAGGISEADLDKQVMAGGWKTEHHSDYANSGQDLFDFNKGNNWKSGITGAGGNWATEQNAINQVLGATSGNNYSTGVGTGSGGGVTDGSVIPPVVTNPANPADPAGNWYDGYASGEDWLKANPQDGGKSGGGMDDFMKFMMMMSIMGGGRGGGMMGGGSQYGYGGLNPGGVQAAYNPWEGMQTGMDFFKNNFGSGVGGGTTLNATGN